MNNKQTKLFKQTQKYASSATLTYKALAESFKDKVTFYDAFMKISEQKKKYVTVLEQASNLPTPSGSSESRFILIMMKLLGKKRILKMMAESEAEQGDYLRKLANDFPQLKNIAQETYLHRNTLLRLRDQLKHEKKSKKK